MRKRYALGVLESWLALAGPVDPSQRNGVTHEPGNSLRQ
jgi:hypothetical protein